MTKIGKKIQIKLNNAKIKFNKIFHRTSVFSVKNVDNSAKAVSYSAPEPQSEVTVKMTENEVKSELTKIAEQYNISYDDLINALKTVANCKLEDLQAMDKTTYNKTIVCLKQAINDSIKDGNVDLSKAASIFIQLKNGILYDGKTVLDARAEVKKNENKDFYDILQEKCSKLKNRPIEEVSTEELKDAIRDLLLKRISDKKLAQAQQNNTTSDVAKDNFTEILSKCSPEERTKIFAAIALLITEERDPELTKLIPEMYKKQLDALSKTDPEKLLKFIKECPELLEAILPKDVMDKIKTLGIQNLPKEKLIELRDKIVSMLETIPAEEIQAAMQVITKVKNGTKPEDLSPEEQALFKKYSELIQEIVSLFAGAAIVFSPDEANEFYKPLIKSIEDKGIKEQVYDLVGQQVSSLSEIFDDYPADKITEVLNKVTDNKYGEVTGNVTKNTTKDSFDTLSQEVINQVEEKIQAIMQTLEYTTVKQEFTVEADTCEGQTVDNTGVKYEDITKSGNAAILKEIFTGKIKLSKYLELAAIKQYKLMDTATQGEMLLKASGKFFSDLVDNTKSSTLENLLSIGWKGKSFDATQKVKTEVEKRNKDAV